MLQTDLDTLNKIQKLVNLPVTHLANSAIEEYRIHLPEDVKGSRVAELCKLLKESFKGRFKFCTPTRDENKPVLDLGLSNFKIVKAISESKTKSPRQKLYSVLMTELAGARGDELASILESGKEAKFKEEFAASVANMYNKFKKLKK